MDPILFMLVNIITIAVAGVVAVYAGESWMHGRKVVGFIAGFLAWGIAVTPVFYAAFTGAFV